MDATAIFERYASDPEVTRFLGWPRHRSLADTEGFLKVSHSEWERWPAGPYLVLSRADGMLLGSGFTFETPDRAATGYDWQGCLGARICNSDASRDHGGRTGDRRSATLRSLSPTASSILAGTGKVRLRARRNVAQLFRVS